MNCTGNGECYQLNGYHRYVLGYECKHKCKLYKCSNNNHSSIYLPKHIVDKYNNRCPLCLLMISYEYEYVWLYVITPAVLLTLIFYFYYLYCTNQ